MTTTKKGRELLSELWTRGAQIEYGDSHELAYTLSLIHRHAKTSRNLCEIMCGDGVHSGEWVNAHHDWLEKRDAQIDKRLTELAKELPQNVTLQLGGDPRGWVVRLIVTDEKGRENTVGVN